MKRHLFIKLLFAVILTAAVVFLPVMAEDEVPVDPIEYQETDTLLVPSKAGDKNVTAEYVYVTDADKPGIDMTADKQDVSATVNGDVYSIYGGAAIDAKDGGTASLQTGNIQGGYGIWARITNNGTINAETGSLTASDDSGLDILIPGAGKMKFTGTDIFSEGYGVTILTGEEVESYEFDDNDSEWIEPIPEEDWADEDLPAENEPEENNENGNVYENKNTSGTSETEITIDSVDAGETAVDIDLKNASTVKLDAEYAVLSDDTGVEIELTEAGGSVTLTAPVIDAENRGLVIKSAGGTVSVTNGDYIDSDSAVEITNEGGEINLSGGGALTGNSGLYVEATGGETKADTADINAQNYGIQVWTHEASVEISPEEENEKTASAGQESNGNPSGQSVPKIVINTEGDITDEIDLTPPEGDFDVDPVPEPESINEPGIVSLPKDAGENENSEESEVEGAVGIIVDAEAESNIEISVKGMISMSYGNEIEASDNSKVTVSIQDDVNTDYGSRIGSYDGADVKVAFGGDINAGGQALDTDADSGNIDITAAKNIYVKEAGNKDTAGIFATSEGTGKTNITVNGGIEVDSKNDETATNGISVFNTGGEINIKAKDVTASGSGAVGLEIINVDDGDTETENIETKVEIRGNLTGTSTGLMYETTEETTDNTNVKADILVTETISGGDAGVVVSEDADPKKKNFDLTVWKIKSGNGHAAVTPDGSAADKVEPEIKYIIKIDPESEDKIKAVYQDGSKPDESHGFMYQKEGQLVCAAGINGYNVTGAFNGKDVKIPLRYDEQSGLFCLDVPNGGGIWLSVGESPEPEPEGPTNVNNFYLIGDLSWLYNRQLPGTGFSALRMTELPARPQGMTYAPTGLTLQIPGLDVTEQITIVPESNGEYAVDWLGSDIGLLEQSSLPGKGVAVLTGHNHLNTTEAGPFLFLGRLEAGDHIMINDRRNNMSVYKVYGSYKISSDGFAEIAGEVRENALVLITCEDESVDGGYLNRRVVMAEPM